MSAPPASGPPMSGPPASQPAWSDGLPAAPPTSAPPGWPGGPMSAPAYPSKPITPPAYPGPTGDSAYSGGPMSQPAYPGGPTGDPAYPGGPMGGPAYPGAPTSALPYPGAPMSGPPDWPGGPPPMGTGYYPYGVPPEPRKKRRGLLITVIVVVAVLLLGGGGAAAFLLTRPTDGPGMATATTAVDDFLQAVYVDQDATKAAKYVCRAARDPKKIAAKIDEIKHQDQSYDTPRYTWSMTLDSSTPTKAVVTAKIKLSTADVQSAAETVKLTVVKSTGWFVCDVAAS